MSKTQIVTGGIADDAVSEEHIDATAITGTTALDARPALTDEVIISDAGTLKRVDYKYITDVHAFLNLDGTGTIAITDSANVASVTDQGTGYYTASFTTNFANQTYCVSGIAETGAENTVSIRTGFDLGASTTAAQCSFQIIEDSSRADADPVQIIFVGDA